MKRHASTASVTSSICSDGGTTGYGTLEAPGQQQLHNAKLITHHDHHPHHQLNNSTSSSSSFTSSCSCHSSSLGAKLAHVQCNLQQGTGSVTTSNNPFQHSTRHHVNNSHIRNNTHHQQSLQQQQQWFAAQTNTRLLAVLSDLVKAFIDSESAIQSFLNSFGSFLDQGNIAADNTIVADNNDLPSIGTVGSMNILANNNANANSNFNSANNNNIDSLTELIDDGPELITPSAALIGLNDPSLLNDLADQLSIDDDIVLGASRRLRAAVGRILHLFQTVMSLPLDQQKNKLHHLSQLSLTNSECDALGQINSNRASPTSDKCDPPKAQTEAQTQPPDQTSTKHEDKVHSKDDGTKGSSKGNQPTCNSNSPPSPQSSTTSSDNCNCNCNQEKKVLFEELTRAQLSQKILQEELDTKHRQLSSLKARIDSTLILDAQSLKETNDDLKHKLGQAESKIGQLITLIEKLRTECQEKGVQIVTLIQQLEHLKQKQQQTPRDQPQPSSPNFVTNEKEEPSKLPCQGLNVPNVNTQVGTSNTAKEPTGGQTGKKAKSEFLRSHPVTSTPASKKVGTSSKSTVPAALRPRAGVNNMGTVTSGSSKLINTEPLEEPKMNSMFEVTMPHDTYSLHSDEIARRRSLSPPESLIVDVKAPFTIGKHRESLLFERTDLANLDDISSLSDDESQDGRVFNAKKVNDHHVTLQNNNSKSLLLGASDAESKFELTTLFNQILTEKDEEITLLKEQMKLAQDMLSSTFGSGSFEKSPTTALPPCNIDQVDLLEALSGKRASVASSVESKPDKMQHPLTDGQTENLIKSSPAKVNSGARVKNQKGRKNKFAGVDLIGPLAEHMPSTSTSGQITPKSTSGSSGCLAFNRGQSREEFVDDGFDDSPNSSFRDVVQIGSRLDQLQTVILALVDKNQAAQQELSQLKSQLENKEQMVHQLSNEKSSLESQVTSLKQENESLIKQLKAKDDEVKSASMTAKNSFDRQLVYYKKALELKDDEISSYEERISGLLRKIDSLKNDSEQNRSLGRAEQAEYTEQINQLKNYIKDQAKTINTYEAKVSSLLSKIESLRLQNDLMKTHEKRIEELELQLKTSEEINLVKKNKIRQLMDTIGKQSNEIKLLTQSNMNAIDMATSKKVTMKDAAVEAKVLSKSNSFDDSRCSQNNLQMHLLRKTLHEKRSLIYQKQYLLNVLSGFQLSEKATLGLLANISDSFMNDTAKSFGKTALGDLNYLTPRSKFRSAVYVIISLMRMKKLVVKWSLPNCLSNCGANKCLTNGCSVTSQSESRQLNEPESPAPSYSSLPMSISSPIDIGANNVNNKRQKPLKSLTSLSYSPPGSTIVQRPQLPPLLSPQASLKMVLPTNPSSKLNGTAKDRNPAKCKAAIETNKSLEEFITRLKQLHGSLGLNHNLSSA